VNKPHDPASIRHELKTVLAGLREFERQVYQNEASPREAEALFKLSLKKLHAIAESCESVESSQPH
jgi:hypothetical protein